MSDGTVQRYWVKKGHLLCKANAGDPACDCQTPCIKLVDASDYDTLRTQARELAKAIETIIKIRNGPHSLGGIGKATDMWREAEYVSKTAQAVMKEGV